MDTKGCPSSSEHFGGRVEVGVVVIVVVVVDVVVEVKVTGSPVHINTSVSIVYGVSSSLFGSRGLKKGNNRVIDFVK